MLLAALILYAVLGLLVGALNYMVEEGDPGNDSAHWTIVARSVGIGLIWLPYALFASYPRRDRVTLPHPVVPAKDVARGSRFGVA